jgi:hypothetical protein
VVSGSLSSSKHLRTSEEFVGAVGSSGWVTRYNLLNFFVEEEPIVITLFVHLARVRT